MISQIAGCLARLFTTATEVGDAIIATGFALALALNIVLGAQLWMYWGDAEVKDEFGLGNGERFEEKEKSSPYEPAPWQQQPEQRIAATPSSPALGSRKWARKVD